MKFDQKKRIAKALSIKDLVEYLNLHIDGAFLRENKSIHFYDNFTRFKDFSCNEKYGYGDVIAFWNYYTHYQTHGISDPIPFKEAVDEVCKIHCEINPTIVNEEIKDEEKLYVKKPPIPRGMLNREMASELQQSILGFDEKDENYEKLAKTPKTEFKEKYGMSKQDYMVRNVRNQMINNLTCGEEARDDFKENEYTYKKTNYLMGYLMGRGISRDTIEKFCKDGYLIQTTRKWAQREGINAKTVLKDGQSITTLNGKEWTPVEDGFLTEKYNFYNITRQATFLSYDKDGVLNSMWSRGFYNGTDQYRKPQFSYKPKDRDNYEYKDHVFLYDPEHTLAVKNAYIDRLLFSYIGKPEPEQKHLDREKTVVIFESTIDLMSFYDLCKKSYQDPKSLTFCSLNGAGKALAGVQELVNDFGYKNFAFCLDADRAGEIDTKKAMEWCKENDMSALNLTPLLNYPSKQIVDGIATTEHVKDMNEALQYYNNGKWGFVVLNEIGVKVNEIEKTEIDMWGESLAGYYNDDPEPLNTNTSSSTAEKDVDEDEYADFGFYD